MKPGPDAPYSVIVQYETDLRDYDEGIRARRSFEEGKFLEDNWQENTDTPSPDFFKNRPECWRLGYEGVVVKF